MSDVGVDGYVLLAEGAFLWGPAGGVHGGEGVEVWELDVASVYEGYGAYYFSACLLDGFGDGLY